MDLARPISNYVYLVKPDVAPTTAYLCPYRVFQRLMELYRENPTKYPLKKDFLEMENSLEKFSTVEMMPGIHVERYPLHQN